MPRYVVFVKERPIDKEDLPQWMAVVEAEDEIAAVYQYPRYFKMWKYEFFRETHKSVADLETEWGDTVCVKQLDTLLMALLST